MCLQSAWFTQTASTGHHVLYSTVGIVLSQTGDWFGGRSKLQKENNDSSANDSNSTVKAGSNCVVSSSGGSRKFWWGGMIKFMSTNCV